MKQDQRGEHESSSNGTAHRARQFSWADWHSLTMPLLELPLPRSDDMFAPRLRTRAPSTEGFALLIR